MNLSDANNPLNFPLPRHIQGIEGQMPFFLVGDDAFGLSMFLMKPFSKPKLNLAEQVYNYRISRARMVVENAFRILTTKFRVLQSKINLKPENAEKIIKCCLDLHNYL